MDFINKLKPTRKQTAIKVFLISILPFKFDKWAPKYPPKNEPNIRVANKFIGIEPNRLSKNAPIAFQKIPTVKKVELTALRKSILKVFINKKVTNKPVPEEIEPLRIPIKKIGITNLNFKLELVLMSKEFNPKLGLRNEYKAKIIENKPKNK